MKTMKDLSALTAEERWQEYDQLRDEIETLYGLYVLTNPGKPSETVKAFVEAVGRDEAVKVVATLVNMAEWDGRINAETANWAVKVPTAWDEEPARKLGLLSRIHTAHLNQIARAMMREV